MTFEQWSSFVPASEPEDTPPHFHRNPQRHSVRTAVRRGECTGGAGKQVEEAGFCDGCMCELVPS